MRWMLRLKSRWRTMYNSWRLRIYFIRKRAPARSSCVGSLLFFIYICCCQSVNIRICKCLNNNRRYNTFGKCDWMSTTDIPRHVSVWRKRHPEGVGTMQNCMQRYTVVHVSMHSLGILHFTELSCYVIGSLSADFASFIMIRLRNVRNKTVIWFHLFRAFESINRSNWTELIMEYWLQRAFHFWFVFFIFVDASRHFYSLQRHPRILSKKPILVHVSYHLKLRYGDNKVSYWQWWLCLVSNVRENSQRIPLIHTGK